VWWPLRIWHLCRTPRTFAAHHPVTALRRQLSSQESYFALRGQSKTSAGRPGPRRYLPLEFTATPLVESSIRQIIMIISIYSHIGNNKGQDTENQLDELRRYAGSQQREVYLFVDRDAGKTGHRAEFQKPIPLCRAPRVPSRAGMGPGSLYRRECRRGLREHPETIAV